MVTAVRLTHNLTTGYFHPPMATSDISRCLCSKTPQLANDSYPFGRKWLRRQSEAPPGRCRDPTAANRGSPASVGLRHGESGRADGKKWNAKMPEEASK